jgi:cytochrome c-type biogenesis protein CcmH
MEVEVSRRLLAADRAGGQVAVPGPGQGILLGLIGVVLVGSFALYDRLGAPGYPDMGLAERIAMADQARLNRPDQAAAEAALGPATDAVIEPELKDLMEKLRAAVKANPDDLQGQAYLAQYEAEIGNYRAAAVAQGHVVRLKGNTAGVQDQMVLADLLIRAAEGYISPEAEAALTAVLTADPENGLARYYSGLLLAQTGRPDLGFELWRRLVETSDPDAAWMPPLQAGIAGLAELAGVNYDAPAATGPDQSAVDAAAGMSDADRQAMIGGMVEQLAERLATEGGTGAEWARLITSLGVLGQTDRARAIWSEAQTVFAASPADLDLLRQAAVTAGIAG